MDKRCPGLLAIENYFVNPLQQIKISRIEVVILLHLGCYWLLQVLRKTWSYNAFRFKLVGDRHVNFP